MIPWDRFARVGEDVRIDPTVLFFRPEKIAIGDRVRIDAFSLLSAGEDGIAIGNNVHIAAEVALYGGGGPILLEDFCGLSGRVLVYTASDDYTDGFLTNPTVPDRYRKVHTGPVTLRKHAIIGAGSVLLPGVELGVGAAIGALSLVTRNVGEFVVAIGNPLCVVRRRDRSLLDREADYLRELQAGPGGNGV